MRYHYLSMVLQMGLGDSQSDCVAPAIDQTLWTAAKLLLQREREGEKEGEREGGREGEGRRLGERQSRRE